MDQDQIDKSTTLMKSVRDKVKFYKKFRIKRDRIFAEQRAKQANLEESTK